MLVGICYVALRVPPRMWCMYWPCGTCYEHILGRPRDGVPVLSGWHCVEILVCYACVGRGVLIMIMYLVTLLLVCPFSEENIVQRSWSDDVLNTSWHVWCFTWGWRPVLVRDIVQSCSSFDVQVYILSVSADTDIISLFELGVSYGCVSSKGSVSCRLISVRQKRNTKGCCALDWFGFWTCLFWITCFLYIYRLSVRADTDISSLCVQDSSVGWALPKGSDSCRLISVRQKRKKTHIFVQLSRFMFCVIILAPVRRMPCIVQFLRLSCHNCFWNS